MNGAQSDSPTAREIVTAAPAFDMHSHLGRFFAEEGDAAAPVAAMRAGGVVGCVASVIADLPVLEMTDKGYRAARPPRPGELFAGTSRQLDRLDESMHRTGLLRAPSARAVREAATAGRVAMIAGIEGGDFLERDAGRVEWAHGRGVRLIQLVHFRVNALGDVQTEAPQHGGLTNFGTEAVAEMDRLGIIIDVAHATFDTVKGVVAHTRNPIVLSHTLLGDAHPRMVSVDHARAVAATGGVVGVWPSGRIVATFDAYVDGILRMIDAVGIDAVGIGTDHGAIREPVFGDYARFDVLATALLARGLSAPEVGKILGGNFLRVLERVVSGTFLRAFEQTSFG